MLASKKRAIQRTACGSSTRPVTAWNEFEGVATGSGLGDGPHGTAERYPMRKFFTQHVVVDRLAHVIVRSGEEWSRHPRVRYSGLMFGANGAVAPAHDGSRCG